MDKDAEDLRKELEERAETSGGDMVLKAAVSLLDNYFGGGLIGATTGISDDQDQSEILNIITAWMALKEDEIEEIGKAMATVVSRLDTHDESIRDRVSSKEYKSLLKKAFRDWAGAESDEKQRLITNLLTNAAESTLSSDDVVRIFIDWITDYSELHFKVIGEIYRRQGITRRQIWENLHGQIPREDSAEADLFKLIIHDLSVGHIARQHREVDYQGDWIPAPRKKQTRGGGRAPAMSAFDGEKGYDLTELGKQFVHYTMEEHVTKLEDHSEF